MSVYFLFNTKPHFCLIISFKILIRVMLSSFQTSYHPSVSVAKIVLFSLVQSVFLLVNFALNNCFSIV